jgi:hypothetical protein
MSKTPAAYSINHEGLVLDIAILETERLLIHEMTIPLRIKSLKESIKRDGVQSAPILVDRNTHVVLDGMHRIAVLKELDCRFTCVCLLDYFDPSIRVQRWCRIIPAPFSIGNAENLLNELNLKLEPYDIVESPDNEGSLLIIFKDTAFKIIADGEDLVETFRKTYNIETRLNEWGYHIEHCTESEAREHLTLGSFEATIFPPKIEKEQVIKVAQCKQILTPKATRHKLPARPVAVNAPLSLLKDRDITVEEANRRLAEYLRSKKLRRYNPGAHWMRRTYDEVLYVFSDS